MINKYSLKKNDFRTEDITDKSLASPLSDKHLKGSNSGWIFSWLLIFSKLQKNCKNFRFETLSFFMKIIWFLVFRPPGHKLLQLVSKIIETHYIFMKNSLKNVIRAQRYPKLPLSPGSMLRQVWKSYSRQWWPVMS